MESDVNSSQVKTPIHSFQRYGVQGDVQENTMDPNSRLSCYLKQKSKTVSSVKQKVFALKALKTALRLLRDGWFGFTAQV